VQASQKQTRWPLTPAQRPKAAVMVMTTQHSLPPSCLLQIRANSAGARIWPWGETYGCSAQTIFGRIRLGRSGAPPSPVNVPIYLFGSEPNHALSHPQSHTVRDLGGCDMQSAIAAVSFLFLFILLVWMFQRDNNDDDDECTTPASVSTTHAQCLSLSLVTSMEAVAEVMLTRVRLRCRTNFSRVFAVYKGLRWGTLSHSFPIQ